MLSRQGADRVCEVIEFLLGNDIDENFQVTEFLNVNMWKDMFHQE